MVQRIKTNNTTTNHEHTKLLLKNGCHVFIEALSKDKKMFYGFLEEKPFCSVYLPVSHLVNQKIITILSVNTY